VRTLWRTLLWHSCGWLHLSPSHHSFTVFCVLLLLGTTKPSNYGAHKHNVERRLCHVLCWLCITTAITSQRLQMTVKHTHTGDLNVDVSSSLLSLCGSSPNLSSELSNLPLCFVEFISSASTSRFISSSISCSNDCDSSSSAVSYFAEMYGFVLYSPTATAISS